MCDAIPQQSSQQPTEQQGSLKEMFEQGMSSIAVHRKENVFQDLDKRTLTEEEQAVIQRRVEHQRKMYELFEKRERQRKIQELREVCPDINDEEAAFALDLCKGDEEKAAMDLVSDAGFRRRVLQPGSVAYTATIDGPREKKSSKRADNWHAKPDGARPKLVDRASLEGTIFVGAFRGKGFQGNGAGRKTVMRKLTTISTSSKDSGKQPADEEEEATSPAAAAKKRSRSKLAASAENNENAKSPEEIIVVESQLTPEDAKQKNLADELAPLSQNGETPVSIPKKYALVKEDSEGNVYPVSNSEVKRIEVCDNETPAASASVGRRRSERRQSTDSTAKALVVVREEEPPVSSPPSATRRSSRQRTVRPIDPGFDTKADEYLDRVIKSTNTEAAAFLKSLPKKMSAFVLETLGMVNPEKAVNILEIMEAPMKEEEPVVVSQCSSEATQSVKEQDGPSSGSKRKHPQDDVSSMEGVVAKSPPQKKRQSRSSLVKSAIDKGIASSVISAKGHTNRGRVKQKSHKSAELVEVGVLRAQKGWYNAGYIFPDGFKSRTLFRSSVALDSLCVHECDVIGRGGAFWPAPTFRVVALDRPDEPLIAKSCTGCWTAVLKRINAEIEARRQAGEDLPPPPRTAIAGPEYFGFNQPDIVTAVEALDQDEQCFDYWAGKAVRQQAAAGLPVQTNGPKASRRPPRPVTERFNRSGRRGRATRPAQQSNSGAESGEEDDETHFISNKWSAVSRTERYRNRLQENGDEEAALKVDSDNPLPDFMDPITLEPVIRPAISPYGHVMGAATWKAVLAEQGVCPFTKKPLKWEQCRLLTKANIDIYRDSIIQ